MKKKMKKKRKRRGEREMGRLGAQGPFNIEEIWASTPRAGVQPTMLG